MRSSPKTIHSTLDVTHKQSGILQPCPPHLDAASQGLLFVRPHFVPLNNQLDNSHGDPCTHKLRPSPVEHFSESSNCHSSGTATEQTPIIPSLRISRSILTTRQGIFTHNSTHRKRRIIHVPRLLCTHNKTRSPLSSLGRTR